MAKERMSKRRKLSPEELSSFCEQIALMLDSGMTLYDGIEMLAEDEQEEHGLYRTLLAGMGGTGSLYEALRQDETWPRYMVQMVGIGEETGRLEDIMQALTQYYEREGRIRTAASSAITYPLVLGAMLVVIILVLLWRVLPVFNRVLDSLGVGGTESGAVLMNLGATVGWVVLGLIGLVGVAVLVCLILMKTACRDRVTQLIQRLFPPLKRLNGKLSSARVASMLSLMLSSGYPMERALEMAPYALTDEKAARRVEGVRLAMAEGATFTEALGQSKLFEDFYTRMIRVGAASGHEAQVMAKIAAIYEEQVEDGFTRLVGIIEPTLVALLSVVVGAILLSVMLPMAGILSNL